MKQTALMVTAARAPPSLTFMAIAKSALEEGVGGVFCRCAGAQRFACADDFRFQCGDAGFELVGRHGREVLAHDGFRLRLPWRKFIEIDRHNAFLFSVAL